MARGRIGLFALCAALAGGAFPCNLHEATPVRAAAAAKEPAAVWVGPAFSGSWFSTDRSGEGFTLQVLDGGNALALWFTYPPEGSPSAQAWIYAEGGRIEGERIRFEGAFTTRGPRFGAAYDPAALEVVAWGTLEFRFLDCNRGEVSYAGPAGWGSGTRQIVRLTALAELECEGKRRLAPGGARSMDGLRQRSGAWFDPGHNGEGWNVEELPDGRVQVYWFTYDERGEQAWTIGVAPAGGDRVEVAQNLRPVGTRFGAGFDPARVRAEPWGRLSLRFEGCDRGSVEYDSSQAGFGQGSLRPVRLTRLAGAACLEAKPEVPAAGLWSTASPMPEPAQSEAATATAGARTCVAGGYPSGRDVRCYDAASDSWVALPELPGSRDHAVATAVGGDLLVTGGYRTRDSGDALTSGWRYRSAENRWESVALLPDVVANGATFLDGFAYFGDMDGSVVQFDPRTLAKRRIPWDGRAPRDHAQLVAFQGELWMIAGRDPLNGTATSRVSIFDPASERWREGPALPSPTSGFAVAASPEILVVAGGERFGGGALATLDSVRAIAAGDASWTNLPPLPVAVHGVGGALHGKAFYTFGGSTLAAGIRNTRSVQVYRWGS